MLGDDGRWRATVARLAAAGCVAAEAEATELLASDPGAEQLDASLRRRERGEPLAWITGRCRFAGAWLRIDPGVYVPRPQTEALARRAARLLPPGGRALDLCTGAGAVAAHLRRAVPGALVAGVDLSAAAVACARANGVPAVVGDLGSPVGGSRPFDVVTCVAPYVPREALALLAPDVLEHEPVLALDGGADGLEIAHRAVLDAARLLRPGGWLLLELGGDQDARLAGGLAAAGFDDVRPWSDGDGDLRGLVARSTPAR